jgi:hypothetical protein
MDTELQAKVLRVNYVLAGAALAVILALLLVSAYSLRLFTDAKSTIPDRIEAIPLFPGAQNVKSTGDTWYQGKEVYYEVSSSTEQIVDFYSKQLLRTGWVQSDENRNFDYEVTPFYVWQDKDDRLPYTLELQINIVDYKATHPSFALQSIVQLSLCRMPILDKTPIYPGAEAVETTTRLIWVSELDAIPSTLITFRTKASRAEVVDYYLGIMQEYGWDYEKEAYDNDAKAYIKDSVLFGWDRGGPETGIVGASVTLQATEQPSGETKVQLDLRGAERFSP